LLKDLQQEEGKAMQAMFKVARVLGWRSILRSGRIRRISQDTLRGFYATRAIIALLDVGLFDELEERKTVHLAEFAARENLDFKVLQTLCDYLYELRILKCEGESYALDSDGELISESMKGVYYITQAYEDAVHNLELLLRKEKTYGLDIQRRAELVAKGSNWTGQLLAFPMVYEEIRRNDFHCILDLGCGDGAFLIGLCQRNPDVYGYGLDIAPEAIALGKRHLEDEDLQDRVQLFVGDIFDIGAIAGQLPAVDAATAVYVLHEFQDRIIEVLGRFRAAFPQVPLIICEVIRHTPEELRRKPGGVVEIQFFHELSNQRLFTLEEWRSMFRQAGFADINENYLGFVRTCIYTVR